MNLRPPGEVMERGRGVDLVHVRNNVGRLARVAGIAGAVVLWAVFGTARADESYVVQPGDTLSAIAFEYGVSVDDLVRANGLDDPDQIFAGESLVIRPAAYAGGAPAGPTERYHQVAPGETLSGIAAQFGVSMGAIAAANGLADPDRIAAGALLVIPGGSVGAGSPVQTAVRVTKAEAEAALRAAAREFGVREGLLLSLAWQESGWQQHVVSHAGAVGLLQLTPDTAEWAQDVVMGERVDWVGTVEGNARAGAAVLRHHIDYFGGDEWMALAAYYQGVAGIQRYGPYAETRLYVLNILAMAPGFE